MSGWRTVPLGELLTESRIEAKASDPERRITVKLNMKGVQRREPTAEKEGATRYYVRKAGQFIYGKQNLHKGAFGVVPKELDGFQSSSDLPAFDVAPVIAPEWIHYWLVKGDTWRVFEKLARGVGSRRTNVEDFLRFTISYPSEKAEQMRIIRWIQATEQQHATLTTELAHQRALLKQLRQAILDDAVLGVLDGAEAKDEQAEVLVARIAERKRILISKGLFPNKKRTERYRSTFGSELPKHWTTVELGDVTNIITSGSRGWAEFYSETGPKFIRAQNIRFGELLTTDLACVTPPRKNDGQRTLVERDDLFVVITGAGVSTPARLNDDIGEAYVSQHVALIKPTMPETSEWLLLCLMAPMACRDVLVSRAYGAGKPGLNLDNLRTLVLPFPPLEEQRRILAKVRARLGCLDGLESEVADSELVSSTILQSVLSEVMGGPGVVRYAEAGGKLPLAAEPQVRQGRATKATSHAGEGQLVAARWQKL